MGGGPLDTGVPPLTPPPAGGLICRALLATMPDHNVHSFISLAAPQMGQYGGEGLGGMGGVLGVFGGVWWGPWVGF